MKIAFLITDINNGAGIERVTTNLSHQFIEKDEEVWIISLFRNLVNPTFNLNEKVRIVYLTKDAYSAGLSTLTRISLLFKALKKLRNFIKHNRFDILISQAFLPTLLIFFCRKYLNYPVLICEHFKYDLYGKAMTGLRNFVYRHLGKVITLTEKDQKKFESEGIDAITVPNMISFPVQAHTFKGKRMIAAGRLHPQKGFDLLIPAMVPVFNQFPDWHLDIFGEGEEYEKLSLLISNHKLSGNIKINNFSKNIKDELAHSDIFILSSRYEGFPMILTEALALGTPVVSFDCPEGPGVLLRNGGGLLVPPQDIQSLSEALLKMIASPSLMDECRSQGYKNISEYLPENIMNKWYQILPKRI